MEVNRTGASERRQPRKDRHNGPDGSQARDRVHAVADQNDELDGQLGPDELPDAEEVAMNLEAKRHH